MASQVEVIVKALFAETKAERAKKIMGRMRKMYVEASVQRILNKLPSRRFVLSSQISLH